MMLFHPINIHAAPTHRLECTLHADRADVDVAEHGSDEQHGNDAMDHLGILHRLNRRSVEQKYHDIAADGHRAAAQHHDPVDQLLAGVETVGRRMVVPDHATAALKPFDIDAVGDIAGDPHEKD